MSGSTEGSRSGRPAGGRSPSSWTTGLALAGLLAFAFALRLGAGMLLPNIHHADEVFQATEQAHRAAFGYGIVPWEFRDGARSWALPGFLAGIMRLVAGLGGGATAYMAAIQAALSLLSLSVVVTAFLWGRANGLMTAILAGAVPAVWFELVYFSPKPLSEVTATAFLLPGLYLGSTNATTPRAGRSRLFASGLLLGSAFMLRYHLGPALVLAAFWICRGEIRARWLPLAVGGLVPVVGGGLLDWVTWGAPFASIIANVRYNMLHQSETYGTSPAWFYVHRQVQVWGGAVAPIAILALLGARRQPLLLLVAAAVALTYTMIGHKEYRFIYPAIACGFVLVGLGTGEAARWIIESRSLGRAARVLTVATALASWCVTSAVTAASPAYRAYWTHEHPMIEAMKLARAWPALCGVALLGQGWWKTPGYAVLHRNVEIAITPDGSQSLPARDDAFNLVLASPAKELPARWGFERWRCFGADDPVSGVCLLRRSGRCTEDPDLEINRVLKWTGH